MTWLGMSIPSLPGPKSRRPGKRPGEDNIDLQTEEPKRQKPLLPIESPTKPAERPKTPKPRAPRTKDN